MKRVQKEKNSRKMNILILIEGVNQISKFKCH